MIHAYIQKIIITEPPSPSVIILIPANDYGQHRSCRVLPIWIAWEDALQLSMAMSHQHARRPLTQELFIRALHSLNAAVERVVITRAKGKTVYSELYLLASPDNRTIKLDARPSDAISLAIRDDAPIFLSDRVMRESSFPYIFHKENDRQEMLEFHDLVRDIKPDDFNEVSSEIPMSPVDLLTEREKRTLSYALEKNSDNKSSDHDSEDKNTPKGQSARETKPNTHSSRDKDSSHTDTHEDSRNKPPTRPSDQTPNDQTPDAGDTK